MGSNLEIEKSKYEATLRRERDLTESVAPGVPGYLESNGWVQFDTGILHPSAASSWSKRFDNAPAYSEGESCFYLHLRVYPSLETAPDIMIPATYTVSWYGEINDSAHTMETYGRRIDFIERHLASIEEHLVACWKSALSIYAQDSSVW